MKNPAEWFFWIPRILCILAILFISMFALDSFAPGLTIWEQIRDFLIHLIPTYILLAILIIAWKWEKTGGIILMISGLGLSPSVFLLNFHRTGSIWMALGIVLIINIPFVMVGALFVLSNYLKKKNGWK
ncbi:MAG TPA: hypothetical protein VN249_01135 [Prolixibacteraceae bacterium]|nr:hypothetical protein [Prolixibacteraceae bacterium]